MKKFDAALKKDKDNFLALTEKANTLEAMGSYDECVKLCLMGSLRYMVPTG